jgi:hypothetical protein
MYWPETLRAEAQAEVYLYIDKYYKKLPKVDGRITGIGSEFLDNDVDALRHSYASGVFTQEYGEDLANLFGQVNEWAPGVGSSTSYSSESKNMDLWNNAVGRSTNMDINIEILLRLYVIERVVAKSKKQKNKFFENYMELRKADFTVSKPWPVVEMSA